MRKHLFLHLVFVSLVGGLFAGRVAAQNWSWALDQERYRAMNLFERAQYDKAVDLFRQKAYRAAAAEFEKFKIQFPGAGNLPHVLFMMGYSRQLNRDRYQAIEIYNEVLDFFGDEVVDAAPALYHMGIAYIENGDLRDGMALLQEMVEDEEYSQHPLAAGALRRLADNEWRNGKHEQAVTFWKQVVEDFHDSNRDETNAARSNVTDYYIKEQMYEEYENWLIDADSRDDVDRRRWVAEHAFSRAWGNFHHDWGKYNNFNQEQKRRDIRAFYDWYIRQKPWYESADDPWRFYHNAILFASQRAGDRQETRRLIDESMPLHEGLKEDRDRDGRYAWLADRMREARNWDLAEYCIAKMRDTLHATYKRYEMNAHKGDWTAAVANLEQLQKANHEHWSPRALGEQARVYKDVLRRYEEAIKLYRQLNNPPHNLWAIQDAYKRWGKLDDAIATLTEIENSFPDDAARAVWYKASYLHEAGRSAQAIAQARRLMTVYPRSRESSQAKQLLDQYGVDPGGGVLDEE